MNSLPSSPLPKQVSLSASHHIALHVGAEPAALGRKIAQKLIDAGAGPLLAAAGGLL